MVLLCFEYRSHTAVSELAYDTVVADRFGRRRFGLCGKRLSELPLDIFREGGALKQPLLLGVHRQQRQDVSFHGRIISAVFIQRGGLLLGWKITDRKEEFAKAFVSLGRHRQSPSESFCISQARAMRQSSLTVFSETSRT